MTYLSPRPGAVAAAPATREIPTLAAVIAAVRTWEDIPPPRRVTMVSALRVLLPLYGSVPEAIAFDPGEIFHRLRKSSPAALGLTSGSLAVYKNLIRTVARRLGLMARPRRRTEPLPPAWQALRDGLPDAFISLRLQGFMAWCSDRSIAPGAVNDATLAEYGAHLRANPPKGDPGDIIRRCAKAWGRAARSVPGWPQTTLTAPASTFHYTLPFEAYPASLQADIDAFLRRLSGTGDGGLYASPTGFTPLRPASIKNRKQALRMALAALVHAGAKAEDIGTLADIVTPAHLRRILDWHWQRAGRKVTGNLGAVGDTLRIIARHHVGLQGDALTEALAIIRTAKPKKRSRMTAKNERRLAQFDDPTVLAMMLHLSGKLMHTAALLRQDGQLSQAAWTASLAVAVEIELHCPMRLRNLVELRLGHDLVRLGTDRQRFTHFLIGTTKNEEPLRWPINARLAAVIETFITEYRTGIGGAGSDYLFAGRDNADRPRAASGLGTAITRAVREHVGIQMNLHLYRALAGKLILDENPGAIEEVRQVLGHRTFATAMEYYLSAQPQRAALRHDARISRLLQQTRTQARLAFAGFRHPRRLAPKAGGGGRR